MEMSRPRSRSPNHRFPWRHTDSVCYDSALPVDGGPFRNSRRSEQSFPCHGGRAPYHSSDNSFPSDLQREADCNRISQSQSEERRGREHRFRREHSRHSEEFRELKDQVFCPREAFQGKNECNSSWFGSCRDHDHRDCNPELSHWERPTDTIKDQFRTHSREWLSDDEPLESHSQGDRRSPSRAHSTRSSYQGWPRSYRGRGFRNHYAKYSGRTEPAQDQQSEGYQEPFQGRPRYQEDLEERPRYQSHRENRKEKTWAEEFYQPAQTEDPYQNPDPKFPRNRLQGRCVPSQAEKETLTIKVDMNHSPRPDSRPPSLDRQLSLDLVHVGRRRLDMLSDESGCGEGTTHMGTFAQEVITLLHHVKDQFFRGRGLTLDQRFSAAQRLSHHQEEELTLDRRFSSERALQSNMKGEDLLLVRHSSSQLHRGDLRLDLEKKRKEKHEEVKVTIRGTAQRPLSAGCLYPEGQTDCWTESGGRRLWRGYNRGRSFPFRNSRFSRRSSFYSSSSST